jgi:hypothetical protein
MYVRTFALSLLFLFVLAPFAATADDVSVYWFGDPGCDSAASTFWFDLAPGERFELDIDLSQCDNEMLGYYMLYGDIAKRNSSDTLTVADGVVLEALDLDTGMVHTGGVSSKDDERVVLKCGDPTRLTLSAENTNGSTVTIRLSWSHLIVAAIDTTSDGSDGATSSDTKQKPGRGKGRNR